MSLFFILFLWRDELLTTETNAENKITALESREQELQTVIQQLSVDLQNVSLSQVRFDSKSSLSAEVGLDTGCVTEMEVSKQVISQNF